MDISKIGFLAFLSPLALCFQQVRTYFASLISFLIKTEVIRGSHGGEFRERFLFIDSLYQNSKILNIGNSEYLMECVFDEKEQLYRSEYVRFNQKVIIFYKKWFPIIVGEQNIIYFNLPFIMKEIMKNFAEHVRLHREKRNNVYFEIKEFRGRSLKSKDPETETQPSASFGSAIKESSGSVAGIESKGIFWYNLALTPLCSLSADQIKPFIDLTDVKNKHYFFSKEALALEKDILFWKNSERWFVDRDIPWKRSTLLYGEPGTGKSSMILNIARKHKICVNILDISTMDNNEFCNMMGAIAWRSIVIIEDIDRVFKGEVNVNRTDQYGGLTFDCLLNKLSGVNSLKNAYVILTANDITNLPAALLREGRVDNKLLIGKLCQDGKKHIADRLLGDWPELVQSVITDEPKTAAQFENQCIELAVAEFSKGHNIVI